MAQKDDIETLKKQVNALTKRVEKLEEDLDERPVPEDETEAEVQEAQEEHIEEIVEQTPKQREGPVVSGNVLGWIGGVVLALGLIFLVIYAFEQGWVSKAMQVILGALAGLVLAGIGVWMHPKMPLQGALVTGAGTAVTYFSVYAGYAVDTYRAATSLNVIVTVILLIAVLLGAAIIAFRQHSAVLLIETVLLAHLTTLLTAFTWFSTVYVLLVIAAFVSLVVRTRWSDMGWYGGGIAFIFALIMIPQSTLEQALLHLIGLFVAFTALSLARHSKLGQVLTLIGAYILALVATGFTTLEPAWVTLIAAGIAILLYVFMQGEARNTWYLVCGASLLALWVPLELEGFLITAAWFVLAAVLAWIGSDKPETRLATVASILFILPFLRLILYDSWSLEGAERIWTFVLATAALLTARYKYLRAGRFEHHVLCVATAIAAGMLLLIELPGPYKTLGIAVLALATVVYSTQRTDTTARWTGFGGFVFVTVKLLLIDSHNGITEFSLAERIVTFLLIAAAMHLLSLMTERAEYAESSAYFLLGTGVLALLVIAEATAPWNAILLAGLAAACCYAAERKDDQAKRVTGLILYLLSAIVLLTYVEGTTSERLIGYLITAALAFGTSYRYAVKNYASTHALYIGGVALLATLTLLEAEKVWITVLWAAIGVGSYVLGLQTERPVPRITGLVLIALAIAKLFLMDTLTLSAGLRIVAYIVLGVLLLGGSIVYARTKKPEKKL